MERRDNPQGKRTTHKGEEGQPTRQKDNPQWRGGTTHKAEEGQPTMERRDNPQGRGGATHKEEQR
jgi:hypothetical protein